MHVSLGITGSFFFCYIYIVEINLQFTHQGSFRQGMNFVNSQLDS
ncbi:hypothetical protein Hdeb2414_s0009g00326971 [Helianthus debilis subsp. tardiflorus]